jgi:hypothetical protein
LGSVQVEAVAPLFLYEPNFSWFLPSHLLNADQAQAQPALLCLDVQDPNLRFLTWEEDFPRVVLAGAQVHR